MSIPRPERLERPRRTPLAMSVLAAACLLLLLVAPAYAAPVPGSWSSARDMGAPRTNHTATLLYDGRVLVVAGETGAAAASAEMYSPATNSWAGASPLPLPWRGHTATRLLDGRVLVSGGTDGSSPYFTNFASIYDPGSDSWTPTGGMVSTYRDHAATLLLTGKVLAVGNGAEVYDPRSGTWSATAGPSLYPHFRDFTVTLMRSGKVLVAGGINSMAKQAEPWAEAYDPGTGLWTAVSDMTSARAYHTATLLPSGKVLVAGGEAAYWQPPAPAPSTYTPYRSAELFDPATGTWSATGNMIDYHTQHTATLLPNGKVLVAGGFGATRGVPAQAELYDPKTGAWSLAGAMITPRGEHTATLMFNGQVLVTGGNVGGVSVATAERYRPAWDGFLGLPDLIPDFPLRPER